MASIYQPPSMASIYQPPSTVASVATSSSGTCLTVATILSGLGGWAVWGSSIGFMLGWEYTSKYSEINTDDTKFCTHGGVAKIQYGWYVSVPTNAAMVYVTARIIFLITSRSFPSPALLVDLHECVARMAAFTVLSLTMWAASLSWLVKSDCERNVVYHACNYGFVVSALVAGLAGGLWTTASRTAVPQQQVEEGAPKYEPPRQPPQTYYNQAYAYHPGHYR